jgi:hypothetical protein
MAMTVVVVVVVAINQVRINRNTSRLPRYIAWCVARGLVLVVLALLPGLALRLHHYIVVLMLFPDTTSPTRLPAIYQAFLLGLLTNGRAALAWDLILRTVSANEVCDRAENSHRFVS